MYISSHGLLKPLGYRQQWMIQCHSGHCPSESWRYHYRPSHSSRSWQWASREFHCQHPSPWFEQHGLQVQIPQHVGKHQTCSWQSLHRRWRQLQPVHWSSAHSWSPFLRSAHCRTSGQRSCPGHREPCSRGSHTLDGILGCDHQIHMVLGFHWHGVHMVWSHRAGNHQLIHSHLLSPNPFWPSSSMPCPGSHRCIQIHKCSSSSGDFQLKRDPWTCHCCGCTSGRTLRWQLREPNMIHIRPGQGCTSRLGNRSTCPLDQRNQEAGHFRYQQDVVSAEASNHGGQGGRPSNSWDSWSMFEDGNFFRPSMLTPSSWSARWSYQRWRNFGIPMSQMRKGWTEIWPRKMSSKGLSHNPKLKVASFFFVEWRHRRLHFRSRVVSEEQSWSLWSAAAAEELLCLAGGPCYYGPNINKEREWASKRDWERKRA